MTLADKLTMFALLWSIYGSVYDGPHLLKIAIEFIAVLFWFATIVCHLVEKR